MSIDHFTKLITFVRKKIHKDFAIPQLHLFLLICENEGITQPELAKHASMPQATLSRNVRALGKSYNKETKQIEGYGLVDVRPDLYERRRLACFLTEEGKAVRDAIRAL